MKSTHIFLDACQLYDTFIDSAFGNESVDSHLPCLTKTMSPVHGLSIVGRVPIVIVKDDGICRREIYS